MQGEILITQLNDFIFCPASIYFHNLYGNTDRMLFQSNKQINGTAAHEKVDNHTYSSKKNILSAIDVYCEKYGLSGKIDLYNVDTGVLTERKRTIKTIYDGYVFQVYAQYFALIELGYQVKKISLYSMTDNKKYDIKLPADNIEMLGKFERTIQEMRSFRLEQFVQSNPLKCTNCIYEPACDRGIK